MTKFDYVISSEALMPEAHTRVVRAVMDNALFVLAYLSPATVIATGAKRPSRADILRAALRVDTIDAFTKERMSEVLNVLPTIVKALEELPKDIREDLRAAVRSVDQAKSLSDIRRFLRAPTSKRKYSRIQGLDVGLRACDQMVTLGTRSIYDRHHEFYGLLDAIREQKETEPGVALSIGKADVQGGIGGAAGGCVAGLLLTGGVGCGPGAAGGAVAGAVATSVGVAVGKLWDAVFGEDGIPDGDLGDFPLPGGDEVPV